MTKPGLFLAAIAASTLLLTGCGPSRNYDGVHANLAEQRIAELERQLEEANAKNTVKIIRESGSDKAAVEQGDKGLNVSNEPYAVHITIESSILFKPGSNDLSTQAKGVLARVVALLNEKYQGHDIQVVGHTDNAQISRSKNEWEDNWDLSGGRSRAVLHYLKQKGIPGSRLSFAGYADQKPVASNSSDANKAKNRRVEIVVIPRNAKSENLSKSAAQTNE
jgi:chemotaxis protein MotB